MFTKTQKALSNILQKGERSYHILILTVVVLLSITPPAYAGTPTLITGSVALLQSATTWLLMLIPVGAGLVLGYHALQKSMADDETTIAHRNKLMKNVIIGSAIAETASGFITVVLSFYH